MMDPHLFIDGLSIEEMDCSIGGSAFMNPTIHESN